MRRGVLASVVACAAVALPARAIDYAGYLSVNDEDYGYWEGAVVTFDGDDRVRLDERSGARREYVFAIGHDLARGLVRQYIPRRPQEIRGDTVEERAAVASGRSPEEPEPPSGRGTWVRLGDFVTFGFGQYEGSDANLHVYCDDEPEVWAWLSGPHIEGEDPDDAANRLIADELEMARLKLRCGREIEPTP